MEKGDVSEVEGEEKEGVQGGVGERWRGNLTRRKMRGRNNMCKMCKKKKYNGVGRLGGERRWR